MPTSIHEIACDKIAGYDRLPKNKVIASHLMSDLAADPTTDYRTIVEQLLPLAVQRAVGSTKVTMRDMADGIRTQGSASASGGKQGYQPSSWVKHAQSAREAVLGEIYTDAHHERKRLALFTAEDLESLISRMAVKRDAIEAQRVRFDAILDAMRTTGATIVSDLSDDDLADAIDR